LTLAATVLAALSLAACGSSDENSGDSSSSGSSTSESSSPGESSQPGSQDQGGSREGSSQSSEKSARTHSVEEVSVPLEVSGGGSEPFIVKGGDNSIQEFGDESDESELEAAAQAVYDFYIARATGHWSDACSRMSATLREQLEQLAQKSSEVRGCGPFLEAFTSQLSAATWREINTVDAVSLRHEDEQGFLIYRGAEDTVYAMPLKEEDGAWKVTALSASALAGA
jgi:hypothetical protein